MDERALRALMSAHPTDATLNLHGRFTTLMKGIDYVVAHERVEAFAECKVKGKDVPRIIDGLLRRFIVEGPFDVTEGVKKLL